MFDEIAARVLETGSGLIERDVCAYKDYLDNSELSDEEDFFSEIDAEIEEIFKGED